MVHLIPSWLVKSSVRTVMVHVVLAKRLLNWFQPVWQRRQQVLRAYCPNIYTVGIGLFINHAFSSHPEAKDNLKYEECSEEIIIKSDITVKEEYIEDSKNENLGDINEQIIDWYEPKLIEESKQSPKKKRASKLKLEGRIFF